MEFLEMLQQVEPDEPKPVAALGLFATVEQLEEGATTYSPQTGNLNITVIKPGWSKNNRYYPAEVLKQSANIFEGAKMFADHQTDKDAAARPEGSVRDWVGTITGVHALSDGTVKAIANIHDEGFKTNLSNLKKAGNLSQMGISIRAFGELKQGEAEGRKGPIVESLKGCKSVDFVTFAAAGGRVESMSESFDPNDPDLVKIIGDNPCNTFAECDRLLYESLKYPPQHPLQGQPITEADKRKLLGLQPTEYDNLNEAQKKRFDFARDVGISEADAFKLSTMTLIGRNI
jgi:hypothetical protein